MFAGLISDAVSAGFNPVEATLEDE